MIHRVILRDKLRGTEYVVRFRELSYLDALTFAREERRYQPAVYRYLIAEYVLDVYEKGDSPRSLGVDEVFDFPEHLIKLMVDTIVERSTVLNEEAFLGEVENLGQQSLTLMGTYDVFLYVHLGPELYLQLLTQPPNVRAQMVVLIEKTTGINVKERFDTAVATGAPVDLITTGAEYKKQQRRREKGGPEPRRPVQKYAGRFAENEVPQDIDEMIALSKQTLDEAIAAAQRGKPERFSWSREAAELSRFELEREARLLAREKKPLTPEE